MTSAMCVFPAKLPSADFSASSDTKPRGWVNTASPWRNSGGAARSAASRSAETVRVWICTLATPGGRRARGERGAATCERAVRDRSQAGVDKYRAFLLIEGAVVRIIIFIIFICTLLNSV